MKKIHVEGDPKLKNTGAKQYSMFIGRLNEGKNVLICIRDIEPDEKNPFSATEVEMNIKKELWQLVGNERVKVIVIPDIESVNFGRGVGYDIIEHIPPQEIHDISATKIREQMKQEGKL
jgi:hypothetical protein